MPPTGDSPPLSAKPPRRSALRRLPRNIWVVTFTSFLTDISSEMLTNLLPLFLFNVLQVRTTTIGLIEGVAEMTASLLKVLSGWTSDRLRARKWLAVLGYAISTIAKPLLYFANTWGVVLGVRFLDRTGKGIRTAPRDALVADSIDEDQRGLAYGLHRAGDTGGAVIGLLLALGILLATRQEAVTLDRRTFQIVVLASIIPALLAVLTLGIGAKDPPQKSAANPAPSLSLSGFEKPFLRFLGITVLFTIGNSSDAFLLLRAQSVGLSVIGVLGMMITFNLIYSLLSTPLGALSDRIGRRRLLIVGWLLYAFVYLGFSQLSQGWHAWLLMGVYACYHAMTEGVARAYVADLVPRERRGAAFGIYSAAIGISVLPASLIAGLLWQGAGSWPGLGGAAPFIFGSLVAVLASLLLAASPRHQRL